MVAEFDLIIQDHIRHIQNHEIHHHGHNIHNEFISLLVNNVQHSIVAIIKETNILFSDS